MQVIQKLCGKKAHRTSLFFFFIERLQTKTTQIMVINNRSIDSFLVLLVGCFTWVPDSFELVVSGTFGTDTSVGVWLLSGETLLQEKNFTGISWNSNPGFFFYGFNFSLQLTTLLKLIELHQITQLILLKYRIYIFSSLALFVKSDNKVKWLNHVIKMSNMFISCYSLSDFFNFIHPLYKCYSF